MNIKIIHQPCHNPYQQQNRSKNGLNVLDVMRATLDLVRGTANSPDTGSLDGLEALNRGWSFPLQVPVENEI